MKATNVDAVMPHQSSIPRQIALVAGIVLATGAAVLLAWQTRRTAPDPAPLTLPEFSRLIFDPYPLGFLFQAVVVPAGLIYLLSNTALFRGAVTGADRPRDRPKLFGALLLIQLLVFGYELGRSVFIQEPPTAVLGLLVVVTAGLLGGWRMGLALGLMVMVLHGIQLLLSLSWGPVLASFRLCYQDNGLLGALKLTDWKPLFFDYFVRSMWVLVPIWAGLVTGLVAALLGKRRFAPLVALLLGAGIDLGGGALMALAGVPPGTWMLLPSTLVSGVAVSAVALMVRGVQVEAARRRAEAADLARTQAELRTLRAQINPHFLFNALNTIRYFVRTDPETARRLLIDLSEVFQRALRSGDVVALRDELSYVESYLSLEKARLGDRLQVKWTIRAEHVLDKPVPTLILQPVVENAVIHGIAKKPEGGLIHITADASDGVLLLQVQDDGIGIEPERLAKTVAATVSPVAENQGGIGLRNVDGRLRALYGETYRLAIESQAGRGTRVQLRIPIES